MGVIGKNSISQAAASKSHLAHLDKTSLYPDQSLKKEICKLVNRFMAFFVYNKKRQKPSRKRGLWA